MHSLRLVSYLLCGLYCSSFYHSSSVGLRSGYCAGQVKPTQRIFQKVIIILTQLFLAHCLAVKWNSFFFWGCTIWHHQIITFPQEHYYTLYIFSKYFRYSYTLGCNSIYSAFFTSRCSIHCASAGYSKYKATKNNDQ